MRNTLRCNIFADLGEFLQTAFAKKQLRQPKLKNPTTTTNQMATGKNSAK